MEITTVSLIQLITSCYRIFKAGIGGADLPSMGRSAGLITIVISLVMSAILFASQWSSSGNPTGGKVDHNANVARANTAAVTASQVMAERELEGYAATHGGYAGAQISDIPGARVLHSDATGYCMQIVSNGVALYDAGPQGSLSPRPC